MSEKWESLAYRRIVRLVRLFNVQSSGKYLCESSVISVNSLVIVIAEFIYLNCRNKCQFYLNSLEIFLFENYSSNYSSSFWSFKIIRNITWLCRDVFYKLREIKKPHRERSTKNLDDTKEGERVRNSKWNTKSKLASIESREIGGSSGSSTI